eukprot:7029712-Alexandrium_andersonii.AAC.1
MRQAALRACASLRGVRRVVAAPSLGGWAYETIHANIFLKWMGLRSQNARGAAWPYSGLGNQRQSGTS